MKLVRYNEFKSALRILMTWCFSTRASVATVLTMHLCISRCLRVNTCMKLHTAPLVSHFIYHIWWWIHWIVIQIQLLICYCVYVIYTKPESALIINTLTPGRCGGNFNKALKEYQNLHSTHQIIDSPLLGPQVKNCNIQHWHTIWPICLA